MTSTLITGGTGFIGSHIVATLTDAQVDLRCLVRPGSTNAHLSLPSDQLLEGDVCDHDSLSRACEGCDCVIHNAALVGDWGHARDFHRVNVEGTLNLLKACVECGVGQVIMTGSISSYGEENFEGERDENSPFNSHYRYMFDSVFPCAMNYYRDSKAQATEQALAFAGEHDLNLTILEPVWVFGEREFNTGFYEYLREVSRGARFLPGSSTNNFHVIYAGDLGRAYLLAWQRRLPGINRIIIGNRQVDRMQDIWNQFCRAAELEPPRRLPQWLVYPVGFMMELLWTLTRRPQAPTLTRGRVNMFYDSITYSTQLAESLLGFRSEYTLAEAVDKTVAWYRDNSYLPTKRS